MKCANFFGQKRSWSKIKDEVLKAYLAPYLAKVSRTRHPIIVADCFAGKGRFDDGSPGSPLIIAEAISHQLADPLSREIKGVFIEKKYHADLSKNLPESQALKILEGDFEDRVEYFIKEYEARDQNLFLYVDPYGIKSILFSYFYRIKSKSFHTVELLLNFNSFGFLREGCRLLKHPYDEAETPDVYESDVNTCERLDEIAGGGYWREIVQSYISGKIPMSEAEELFVRQYCDKLKGIFRYVINIPIKVKLNNIAKYRIVYGTDHADGLLLMVDNMNKRWGAFREEVRNHQSTLFEIDFPDPALQQACWRVDEKILALIQTEMDLKALLVALAQEMGISFSTSEYKDHLKRMEKDGVIEVERQPPTTPTGKPSTSWDHTRHDFRVTIKRRSAWQQSLL